MIGPAEKIMFFFMVAGIVVGAIALAHYISWKKDRDGT